MPAEEIIVTGIVQGVGFRPFVWRLARRYGLAGTVTNRGDAVVIVAAGPVAALDALAVRLRAEAPPLARIDRIARTPLAVPPPGKEFRIVESGAGSVRVGVVADVATCSECLAEMRDPDDRRHGYAFVNCTNCGPRFSIVEGLPYDRARTSMAAFPLCRDCAAEYDDPADRRFHAQPVACPACGPHLTLLAAGGASLFDDRSGGDSVDAAAAMLAAGGIVAVKGLGGFHVACDATDEAAVATLRRRKHRLTKPLAVMLDEAMLAIFGRPTPGEGAALRHPSAPIVLVAVAAPTDLAPSVAPGQARFGAMLPYTPLHHRLLAAVGRPLVMTSGNRSGEPQVFRDADAASALGDVVDAFLTHDRPIARRLDDTVVRIAAGQPRVLRRGRGRAPLPADLPEGFEDAPPVLALGADLKSAVALTHGSKALLSQHFGDLDEPATDEAFATALVDLAALFEHRPAAVAVDPHPAYRASRLGRALAAERALPVIEVQHHHAHIAAAMAESGWGTAAGPVAGLALDGTGLGDDGTAWGAEVLVCDYRTSRRTGGLLPVRLPGGDAASREPWRALAAFLAAAVPPGEAERLADAHLATHPWRTAFAMIGKALNAPPASSAGRLFDAMAALLGLAPARQSFEGEAATLLEAAAEGAGMSATGLDGYRFQRRGADGRVLLDPAPLWRAALDDVAGGVAAGVIAARFHAGVAAAFADLAIETARAHRLAAVAVSGGTFQNRLVLEAVAARVAAAGLALLAPVEVPANDGGLAFGQAAVAAARCAAGR
jgi:hydrogenase maturation protein HypF